jgi:hypothetical protein
MAYDPLSLIDKLKVARASGVLTVHHGETTTTYRSIDEMDRIIRSLQADVPQPLRTRRQRVSYIYQTRKGL